MRYFTMQTTAFAVKSNGNRIEICVKEGDEPARLELLPEQAMSLWVALGRHIQEATIRAIDNHEHQAKELRSQLEALKTHA